MSQQRLFTRSLDTAINESHQILSEAIEAHNPEAVCLLYSGGKDSAVALDVTKPYVTHIVHIDTTIGLEVTRQFVREELPRHGLPWIIETPDTTYEEFILETMRGFPGPAMHSATYQRLKERALRKVRRRFVTRRGQRVLFVSGVRMAESNRRMSRGADQTVQREGSIVWVNPLLFWDNDEMAEYRRLHDLRISPSYEHIHMSGECLCSPFGSQEELAEMEFFWPDDPALRRIRELEKECVARGLSPAQWGPGRAADYAERTNGRLCSNCDVRLPGLLAEDPK